MVGQDRRDSGAYEVHDAYDAYDAYGVAVPYSAVNSSYADAYANGYQGAYTAGVPAYGRSTFGALSTNPKVSPLTAQMAVELGFDPNEANASVMRRAGALFVDSVIYGAIIAALAVIAGLIGNGDSAAVVVAISMLLGPGGFYFYRVAGDSIFEGSPGKHAMGLSLKGAHSMPISARDGFVRNAWLLPSMIPFAGWVVSAGLAAWIAGTAARDPLGRGSHERSIRTRVVEKPDKYELPPA